MGKAELVKERQDIKLKITKKRVMYNVNFKREFRIFNTI